MKVNIHFARIGKPEVIYVEELLQENDSRIITHNVLPQGMRSVWAKEVWAQQGIMSGGEVVCEVYKHHFYREWFDVIELLNAEGRLIGYYCDVLTPLRKENGAYYLKDLQLDLWVFSDGRMVELDWDEFDAAARAGLITASEQQTAVDTLRRMAAEVRQGWFPAQYLD